MDCKIKLFKKEINVIVVTVSNINGCSFQNVPIPLKPLKFILIAFEFFLMVHSFSRKFKKNYY